MDRINNNEKFSLYYNYLVQENEKYNLTNITEKEEAYIKHFYDSIQLEKVIDLNNVSTLCDVGSGAGFPSIPLKILEDSLEVWIVDSLNKRINFLKELCDKLEIKVNLVCDRAEEFQKGKREYFDIVTARAVARLNILDELCMPLVKKDGYFLAMKASEYLEELEEAKKGINILGGKTEKVFDYNLPYNGDMEYRNVIVIKKIEHTNNKYPRDFAKIKKNPL